MKYSLLVIAFISALAAAAAGTPVKKVLVIGIDGLRAGALKIADAPISTPWPKQERQTRQTMMQR